MKTVKLTCDRVNDFREYHNKYSSEQDESFPVRDNYTISEDEPVYLLTDDNENISGAAALMLHKEYMEIKEARFRMFHCKEKNIEYYRLLLYEILNHVKGLNSVYCFIQEKYIDVTNIWESLGFKIRRYSWVLVRDTDNFTPPQFPNGFELKTMADGVDEDSWCGIVNEAFEHMLGHTTMYPDKIERWRNDPGYIKGGMKLLWHKDKPVATAALVTEDMNGEETVYIESIGVLNAYQGKGLGRNLVRAGIEFAKNYGVKKIMLSVNAENEKAAELYLNEGFKKDEVYICYHYYIK